jgi:hypothetical protein
MEHSGQTSIFLCCDKYCIFIVLLTVIKLNVVMLSVVFTQHNDTQHSTEKCNTQDKLVSSCVVMSIVFS